LSTELEPQRRAWHAGAPRRAHRVGPARARARDGGVPVRRRRHARATSLVELLVGTALALVVLSALTAAVGTGARLLLACGARGEAEDTAQLALEALTFDVRRAGWDPAASGLVAVREADADRLVLAADLDGDGAVDDASEETAAYVCLASDSRDESSCPTNPHYPCAARVCEQDVVTARATNPLYSEAEPSQNLPTLPVSDRLPYERPSERGG